MPSKKSRNDEIVSKIGKVRVELLSKKYKISPQRVYQIAHSYGITFEKRGTARRYADTKFVLSALDDFWRKNFRPPTLREMMAETGIPSTSTMKRLLINTAGARGDILFDRFGTVTPRWVADAIRRI